MRYSKADDTLLARFFVNKPEGLTSDKIFQEFARMVSWRVRSGISVLIVS